MYICKYAKCSAPLGKYVCPYREKQKLWQSIKSIKIECECPSDVKLSEDGSPICYTIDTDFLEKGAYI